MPLLTNGFWLKTEVPDLGEIPGIPDSKLFQVYDTYEAVLHEGRFLAGTHEVDRKEDAVGVAARIYKKLQESK